MTTRREEFLRRSAAMKKVANDPNVQEKRRLTFLITKWWKDREHIHTGRKALEERAKE